MTSHGSDGNGTNGRNGVIARIVLWVLQVLVVPVVIGALLLTINLNREVGELRATMSARSEVIDRITSENSSAISDLRAKQAGGLVRIESHGERLTAIESRLLKK